MRVTIPCPQANPTSAPRSRDNISSFFPIHMKMLIGRVNEEVSRTVQVFQVEWGLVGICVEPSWDGFNYHRKVKLWGEV